MATVYRADVVLTGDGRRVPDGGVLVDGEQVRAVGPAAELAADRRHHVDGVVLPGLVDAATLVELSDAVAVGDAAAVDAARALARPAGDEAMAGHWDADRRQRSARRGAQQLLRGGAGLTVDHVRWGTGVSAMGRTRLLGDSLIDVGAVAAGEAPEVAAAVRARLDRRPPGRRIGVAVAAPPDDGDVAGVAAVVDASAEAPLRVITRPGRPVDTEALAHAGVLGPGVVIGPNPGVDAGVAARLARAGATVLVVPRAAAPPDLAALGEGGVEVVLGGGLTAAPDPLADAAAFAALAVDAGLEAWPPPGGPPPAEAALGLVTGAGAAALGWGERAGVLAPGRRADLVAVADPAAASGAADAVLAAAGRQVLTLVGGVQRARRASAEVDWPPIDRQEWRDESG